MSTSPVRIATRHSPLAMWQAEFVAERLQRLGHTTELVPLVSGGDIDMRPMDVAMPGEVRTTGVFTKRIQQALVDNEADVAVHSMKDLPTAVDDRFAMAAVPPRGDIRDALVSFEQYGIEDLPRGGIVGTGSLRRAAQLLRRRPDLQLLPVRGNVQTRLAKLRHGDYAAIVLAEAGVRRLGMDDLPRRVLSVDEMLPAVGQGALAIEVRSDDGVNREAIAALDDFRTHAAIVAERTLLSLLDGGCLAPIAALADWHREDLRLTAMVLSPGGETMIRRDGGGPAVNLDDAAAIGRSVADQLLGDGAANLLRR